MVVFQGDVATDAERIIARYPAAHRRSAVMPLLYLAQSVQGWVSRDALREIGELLGITTAEVESVATFYTMFRLRPTGTHVVNICTNLSCKLRGAQDVYEAAHEAAGMAHGQELSEDGAVTLHEEECLGVCDFAPAVQVNFANHDAVTPQRMKDLIGELCAGRVPAPSRGPAFGSFRAASRLLAGLGEGAPMSAPDSTTPVSLAEPRLTRHWGSPDAVGLDGYSARGGYEGLRRALAMEPADVIDEVKASGLRGRGGAGFPTGMKWGFVPQGTGKPTYVVVNFDESEPGTCNNRELVEREPHRLLEGAAIAAVAIGCEVVFIYVRGEYLWQGVVLQRAIDEAYAGGFFGEGVLGSSRRLDVVLHRGAGAYICGEETALLNSLEGLRGQPRLRPPFPAVEGLYASPTVINNVETLMNVPDIVLRGADWFREVGSEKSPGTKMITLSGKVERPGNYEIALGTPFRTVLDELGGGVLGGRALKAWTPGGSSTPLLTAAHLDVGLDYESIAEAGSLLGTGAMMVMDETDCVVDCAARMVQFYAHESCGKCTPCREGSWWATRVLGRIEEGHGRAEDLPLMADMGRNILFRAFCALADGTAAVINSTLQHFPEEFEAHVRDGRCPLELRREEVPA